MNQKFLIAWLLAFIVWMLGSFVVHGVHLHADYAALPTLFRPDAEAGPYFPVMLLAHLILSGAFVWIYSRGVEQKPWTAQGVRFGIVVALLTVVPTYLIYFAVQPMPVATVAKQIIFDAALLVVLGLVVGWMHRDSRRA